MDLSEVLDVSTAGKRKISKKLDLSTNFLLCNCRATNAEVSSQVHDVVKHGGIPECKHCRGIVKPDIVFFGEDLPDRFRELHRHDLEAADALVVSQRFQR